MASFCFRCMQNTVRSGRCTSCGAPEVKRSESDVNLLPLGTKLDNGNIIVGDKLGAGGFGITYIARDKELGLIALKEFVPRYLIVGKRKGIPLPIDEERRDSYNYFLKSFRREAKVLNDIRHPNIVRVLFEMEEEGTAYYGMELMHGCNLAQWLRQHGTPTPEQACRLLLPVMDALIHIHNCGVLHRDLSPDNIFLRDAPGMYMDVSPCLIDFGAAYVAMDDYTHTVPNVKKKGYSPPDQNVRDVQYPRVDVYAFAATVYYTLTGKVPPPTDDRLSGYAELIPANQLNPKISPALNAVLMKGLEMNSENRIQTMQEFRQLFCHATGVPVPVIESIPSQVSEPISSEPLMGGILAPPESFVEPFTPPSWLDSPAANIPRWKYFFALLIEALLFSGAAAALMLTVDPFIGLGAGIVMMFLINLLLSRTESAQTLGQRLLGMDGLGELTNAFGYNLMRCLLPLSLLDELTALLGLTEKSLMERSFRQTAPVSQYPSAPSIPYPSDVYMPSKTAVKISAALLCCAKHHRGERIPLGHRQKLGRDASRCDIVPSYADNTLSSCHCSIYYSDKSGSGWNWYIEDHHSTNGTYVNGNLLSEKHGAVQLRNGDKITIGSEDYIFKLD